MHIRQVSAFILVAATPKAVTSFTPSSFATTNHHRSTTLLNVSVDPEVVTKKEYQDICGVDFDNRSLEERLQKTNFLYPKHVEVLEDFSPLVDQFVDDIVSSCMNIRTPVFFYFFASDYQLSYATVC